MHGERDRERYECLLTLTDVGIVMGVPGPSPCYLAHFLSISLDLFSMHMHIYIYMHGERDKERYVCSVTFTAICLEMGVSGPSPCYLARCLSIYTLKER